MPKIHFCKNFNNSIQCGEKDPEKFEKGRYSICKSCRSKNSGEARKDKKKDEMEERLKIIDPDEDFKFLFRYQKITLDNKHSIRDVIRSIFNENKQIKEELSQIRNQYNIILNNMYKDIEFLKSRSRKF